MKEDRTIPASSKALHPMESYAVYNDRKLSVIVRHREYGFEWQQRKERIEGDGFKEFYEDRLNRYIRIRLDSPGELKRSGEQLSLF
jgi:hypothetical protein